MLIHDYGRWAGGLAKLISFFTSTNHFSHIIILFNRKRDRINFYSQKGKLCKLTVNQKLVVRETERDSNEEKSNFIFFNESLTLKNRLLLKEAKKKKLVKK